MVEMEKFTSEQLHSLVQDYPWFAAARVQLCMSMAADHGMEAAEAFFMESCPYLPDVNYLSRRLHALVPRNFSDADLSAAIRGAIAERPRVYMAGMDFFSRDDYESERTDSDAAISRIAVVDYSAPLAEPIVRPEDETELISETLAGIYAEQGYPELAKDIYIKLSLQSPEKSAYFASLIDNLNS